MEVNQIMKSEGYIASEELKTNQLKSSKRSKGLKI